MYKLVREGKELRLVEEKAAPATQQRTMEHRPGPVPAHIWTGLSPGEKKLWRSFIESGQVEPGAVAPPILESWTRCWQAEVEFAGGRCRDILSGKELAGRQSLLVELADPIMDTLHQCLKGFGFIVVLVDFDGYVLNSLGDVKSLRQAEKINFGPGANWSELSVGTNAIGTALVSNRGIQVVGPEHYNDGHHLWVCAAVPIRDVDGRVIGCMDISGPRENAGFKLLDMVMAATRFIEDRLHQEYEQGLFRDRSTLMGAAFDRITDGLVAVDASGVIQEVSLSASQLVGLPQGELVGRNIRTTPLKDIKGARPNSRELSRETTFIPSRSGSRSILVSTSLVKNREGRQAGSLIAMSEILPKGPIKARADKGLLRYSFDCIVGQSPALEQALAKARLAASNASTVLIQGESGTGKEVFAQAIHQAGPRREAPFVSINCGAIAKELIQSELFGYAEGAFTGARRGGRRGKFEMAHGGTLFLDEISDMPLDMQANLLRVLEEKVFPPVGGERLIRADFRVIAATNDRLDQKVRDGRFREDLFYRLNVVLIQIPPLRDREGDIPLLAEWHLQHLARTLGKDVRRIHPDCQKALAAHHWPGNVRELINVLEQAVNFMEGDELTIQHLPPHLHPKVEFNPFEKRDKILPLAALEKYAIEHALNLCQGNVSQVARALGIGRNTLYTKMKKYGLGPGERGLAGSSRA